MTTQESGCTNACCRPRKRTCAPSGRRSNPHTRTVLRSRFPPVDVRAVAAVGGAGGAVAAVSAGGAVGALGAGDQRRRGPRADGYRQRLEHLFRLLLAGQLGLEIVEQ